MERVLSWLNPVSYTHLFILDVGKPDKRRWAGRPADLFLRPQYHLLDSFSHSGYFLVYRGCTVWLR